MPRLCRGSPRPLLRAARLLAGTPDEGHYERHMVAALGTTINLDHCKRLAIRVFHAALNPPVARGQDLSVKQGEYKKCKPMNGEASKTNLGAFCGGFGGARSLLRQLYLTAPGTRVP